MNKVTFKIIARKEAIRKDGRCLICLQVFINGVRHVQNLGIAVFPENFSSEKQLLIYKKDMPVSKEEIFAYNDIISTARLRTIQIYDQFNRERRLLSKALFVESYMNEKGSSSFIDFMIKEIELQKCTKENGTIKIYNKTVNKLKRFRKDILFSELNLDLIQKIEISLCKENLNPNSRWSIHKTIKKFVNDAIRKKIIDESPYQYFKSYSSDTHISFLDGEELHRLVDLFESNRLPEFLQNVLRYFLFSCMAGGLRISDIKKLTDANIKNHELVFDMYKFRRSKNKRIVVPFYGYSHKLIKHKYGKLFDTYCDQLTNRYLKEIMSEARIQKRVSFHVARHTFATQFLLSGGKLETLREILGHSKIETTMRYVHIVNDAKRKQMKGFSEMMDVMISDGAEVAES